MKREQIPDEDDEESEPEMADLLVALRPLAVLLRAAVRA